MVERVFEPSGQKISCDGVAESVDFRWGLAKEGMAVRTAKRPGPASGGRVNVQSRRQANSRTHGFGPDARGDVLDEFAELVQHAHCDVGVVGAIKFVGTAVLHREIHPRLKFAIAPIFERLIAEEFAAQAGVGDVFDHDVGVPKMDIEPADFRQAQADAVEDAVLQSSGKHVLVPDHQGDELEQAELHGVEVFDDFVFALPKKVAQMRIRFAGLLAREHGVEHLFGQGDVFPSAIVQQGIGKFSGQPGRVISLAAFPPGDHARFGIEGPRQW